MQNETNSTTTTTDTGATNTGTNSAPAATGTLPAAVTPAAKPAGKPRRFVNLAGKANAKPAASTKPATAKPSAKIKAAKPKAETAAKPPAVSSDRADARAAAKQAVAAYYSGRSLPFKAAVDLPYKADLNPSLQSRPTERTAALIGAILAYCDVQPDGSFVRGSGRVPGKLLGRTGSDGDKLFAAGPESGCTSNMLGSQLRHISGPFGGKQAADTVLRLTNAAIENLLAFNVSNGDGKPRRFTAVLALARKRLDTAKFPALNTGAPKPAATKQAPPTSTPTTPTTAAPASA